MKFGFDFYKLENADVINRDFCKRVSKRKYDCITYSSFSGGRTVNVELTKDNKVKHRFFKLDYVYLKEFTNIVIRDFLNLGSIKAKTLKNETVNTLKTGYTCKHYNTKSGDEEYYVFAEISAVYESLFPKVTVSFVSKEYLKKEIENLPFLSITSCFDNLNTDEFLIQINKNNGKSKIISNVENVFPLDIEINNDEIISFLFFMDSYFKIRGKYNEGTYDNDIINFPFVSVSGLSLNDVNFSFSILNDKKYIRICFNKEEKISG